MGKGDKVKLKTTGRNAFTDRFKKKSSFSKTSVKQEFLLMV